MEMTKKLPSGTTSFIGEFFLGTGMLSICDPMVNDINTLESNILLENHLDVIIRNAACGMWRGFFINDETGMPREVIVHNTFRDSSFYLDKRRKFIKRGTASFGFGRTSCIVEDVFRDDGNFALYNLEEEAFYDVDELNAKLISSPYPELTKRKLFAYLESCKNENRRAYGAELMDIVNFQETYWDGFKKVTSSHWSQDVLQRLSNSPATVIKGGLAFCNANPFSDVYVYVGSTKYVEAVKFSVKMPNDKFSSPQCA